MNRFDIALGKKPPPPPPDRGMLLRKAHLCIAIIMAQGIKIDSKIEEGAMVLMHEPDDHLLEQYRNLTGKEYVYEENPDHGRTGA